MKNLFYYCKDSIIHPKKKIDQNLVGFLILCFKYDDLNKYTQMKY